MQILWFISVLSNNLRRRASNLCFNNPSRNLKAQSKHKWYPPEQGGCFVCSWSNSNPPAYHMFSECHKSDLSTEIGVKPEHNSPQIICICLYVYMYLHIYVHIHKFAQTSKWPKIEFCRVTWKTLCDKANTLPKTTIMSNCLEGHFV